MRQRFLLLCLVGLFFSLTGCSTAELTKAKMGYITDLDDRRILVNDTYFSADEKTEVVSEAGKELKFADLEIGMKVEPWFDGAIRESFPAQADVNKIVVLEKEDGDRVQEAVQAVVQYAEANYGKPVVFQESEVSEEYFQAIIAGMTIEHPNPITIRYNFEAKEIQVE